MESEDKEPPCTFRPLIPHPLYREYHQNKLIVHAYGWQLLIVVFAIPLQF